MEIIYLLEDDDGLKYVGRTTQKLNDRFLFHRSCQRRGVNNYSSSKLDLEKCEKTVIDVAEYEEEARELEEFYINSIDCVNENKLNFDRKENNKKYREKNRDTLIPDLRKRYHYQNTWGGEKRRENNLLRIDVNLFD
tara:strand:+ start:1316 stop:1726 length:411 start_codon:yes stop_codon:yes gene_type:complete